MDITANTAPLLIIRLGKKWKPEQEEIERGYLRTGRGWHPNLTDIEVADSVRAWWKVSQSKLEKKGVEYVVAYADGRTRALYRIVSVLGPREKDGRIAFQLESVTSGDLFDQVIGDEGKAVPFRKGSANPVTYWPQLSSHN